MKVMAMDRDPVSRCWTLPLSELPTMKLEGMPSYQETLEIMSSAVEGLMGHVESTDVPALFTSGWYDPTRTVAFFRAFRERAGSELARTETKLIMGPWGHSDQTWSLGEWGFGRSASPAHGGVPQAAHLDFYSRHLCGDDGAPRLPTVRYFVWDATNGRRPRIGLPPIRSTEGCSCDRMEHCPGTRRGPSHPTSTYTIPSILSHLTAPV